MFIQKRETSLFLFALLVFFISFPPVVFSQSPPPAKIIVSVEPLYEIVATLSHGINKPEVIYSNFNERQTPLSNRQKSLLAHADIIIRVGKGLEPYLDEYIKQQGRVLENKTITLSQYIPLLDKEAVSSDVLAVNRQEKSDLRFWMDPRLVKMLAIYIAPKLAVMDPDHQEQYLDNEIVLKAQLKKIEKKMLQLFNQLSMEQKSLFAQFNPYLKNRYMHFSEIQRLPSHKKNSIESCINNHSFKVIPLNLDYTEKSLYALLQTLELCSQSKVAVKPKKIS
ncbi:metal ABC transporter solute-binding protein, Zn/Mn family [sulfur-oxidizing endosymbiont of Gigantopelta aegis]|uniref:metal ABC transporter solute-binding protein, Zn/Mn family n=1 Tax=sulfur-oxidizing endosymbiont of Gigantopelta aegis TaxID=2794934 RepID=UPI0018DD161C|nr:metal ABC transporter substrate-binding protein [sulfur-oxidizing endosymbiont of Gigantopelta aegis]